MANDELNVSLEQLLRKVSDGSYLDFQAYLHNNNMTELDLSRKAYDLNLAHLAASLVNTKVTKVNLSFNRINSEAAADFAANLKGTKVTEIDLGKNLIDSPGTIATNLIDTNVIEVSLSYNQFGDQGAADFAAKLKGTNVTRVILAGNLISSQGAANFAANLKDTQVSMVDLSDTFIYRNYSDRSDFITNFKDTNVTHLNLNCNEISVFMAIEMLTNFRDTKITELNLNGNKIGDYGHSLVTYLYGSKVTRLGLRGNKFNDDEAVSLIGPLKKTNVTEINLSDNQISDAGAAALAAKLNKDTKLTKIDLSLNKFGDKGATALIDNLKNTLIKDLNLDDNKLSEQTLARLQEALIVQTYAEQYAVEKLNQYFPLSETEKDQFTNKTDPFDNTKEPEQVAFNIKRALPPEFAVAFNIIRALPPELAAHVANFFQNEKKFNDHDETLQATLEEFFNSTSEKNEHADLISTEVLPINMNNYITGAPAEIDEDIAFLGMQYADMSYPKTSKIRK